MKGPLHERAQPARDDRCWRAGKPVQCNVRFSAWQCLPGTRAAHLGETHLSASKMPVTGPVTGPNKNAPDKKQASPGDINAFMCHIRKVQSGISGLFTHAVMTHAAYALTLALWLVCIPAAMARDTQIADKKTFQAGEIVAEGHTFFDSLSRDISSVIEEAFGRHGEPTAYIIGEEASGAFFLGGSYGEGDIVFPDGRTQRVYWQGPSIGLDVGADGARVMMLVYKVEETGQLFGRYAGVSGSAFILGGVGMTTLGRQDINIVPIRSGVGVRLGVNANYLKFTEQPTWNPF